MLVVLVSTFFLSFWFGDALRIHGFSQSIRNSRLESGPSAVDQDTSIEKKNFIVNIIEEDIGKKKNGGRVVTRFPPEPNGYLHLGHAKSICFNFGVARAFRGDTHLRFDDTNPAKEDMEYVLSIMDDVRWLVGDRVDAEPAPWTGPIRHASDYFQTMYEAATYLIKEGLAYVDDLSPDEMKEYRGTLTEVGRDSPFRTRSIEENLNLFDRMKSGNLNDGSCVLRAKIDNSSPNINMRDPTIYRIKTQSHPITGDAWCIYPMYDFAHAISDALESITHSICTLEFADHRPLYDWVIDKLMPSGLLPHAEEGWRPNQIEFSRLNLQYTVLSKRKLIKLVTEKHVDGWDDPRMPTISGIRRRGYPPSAVRLFCDRIGISKAENNIDMSVLEDCVREVLDEAAPRALAVSSPLRVTISNWPKDKEDVFVAERHPKRPELGSREIPFSGSVFIDRDDFFDTGVDGSQSPPKGFKRLVPGGTVRLKYAYVITCDEVVRDPSTKEVLELVCSVDEGTRAGVTPPGAKKTKGIIQWVSAPHAVPVQLTLLDRLFIQPSPGKEVEDGDFLVDLNPSSKTVVSGALVEPSVASCAKGDRFQFERIGYFCRDDASTSSILNFNRIVTLKDTWQSRDGSSAQPGGGAAAAAPLKGKDGGKDVEDIRRVDLRVGLVLSAENHPDAENLLVEKIDCGDATGPRTVVSGLAKFMAPEALVGKKVVVVCNLKPSKMRGIVSEAMVLAASSSSGSSESDGAAVKEKVELLTPPEGAAVGEAVLVEGLAPAPDAVIKSKDLWTQVSSKLMTNAEREAYYCSGDGGDATRRRLLTSQGPCVAATLADAQIG